ncbi:uncharacterized protein LMH87_007602 [Akanthomyces muscarius]|uniref:EKC/KEOPS complex subunit BUD32 n=1 Tax=Akanthomyces muscarius TaxID=2231603 RepID=A0A9W8QMH3_AKAMU|nr:uncharacterized protein LMH87_007602 [Akanthomyces muscarius]KAJ4161570.1 hypothetical protein LMH87_007602 [Akanthomyces muscarius]
MPTLVAVNAATTAADENLNLKLNPRPRARFFGEAEYVEKICRYRYGRGGYHPVHLADTLDQGRYRVIHKLGHGGFSTVWLCLNTEDARRPTYVAVKVLAAEDDREVDCRELRIGLHLRERLTGDQPFCLPLREFRLEGPNGTHICIVYPVRGPTLGSAMDVFAERQDCAGTVRRLLGQVATTLDILHKNGVCHGDLRPENVFIGLKSLDGLDVPAVYRILGEPDTHEVTLIRSDHTAESVPRYLVYPVHAPDISLSYLLPQVYIADFGESFFYEEESPRVTGIPRAYCAPEAVFDNISGPASDLWSLGCLFFETRLGCKIIEPADLLCRNDDEYILSLALILGRLPESWWARWQPRHEYFRPDDDGEYKDEDKDAAANYDEQRKGTHDRLKTQPGKLESFMPCGLKEPRSIREKIEVSCYSADFEGKELCKAQHMTAMEVSAMADLLKQLLRYVPGERISAEDAANHGWYQM